MLQFNYTIVSKLANENTAHLPTPFYCAITRMSSPETAAFDAMFQRIRQFSEDNVSYGIDEVVNIDGHHQDYIRIMLQGEDFTKEEIDFMYNRHSDYEALETANGLIPQTYLTECQWTRNEDGSFLSATYRMNETFFLTLMRKDHVYYTVVRG